MTNDGYGLARSIDEHDALFASAVPWICRRISRRMSAQMPQKRAHAHIWFELLLSGAKLVRWLDYSAVAGWAARHSVNWKPTKGLSEPSEKVMSR